MIVIVGTVAAILLHTSPAVFKHAFKIVRWVVRPPHSDRRELIQQIVEWSNIARRQGLLGLESQVEAQQDPFLRKGLQLLVDGVEPESMRHMLEIELGSQEHQDQAGAKVFEAMGIYAPTLGIIGAVLGLIAVMKNLADPSKLGHGIAAAFTATIYGIASANLLFLPIAAKLKSVISHNTRDREMVIEGLIRSPRARTRATSKPTSPASCTDMARRKHHEEHANHEAWAIPYADLMTLLLAFFVVMYAISSVNEGKYRIMADALTDAFGGAPRTINPVQVGNKQVQGGGWDSPSVIKSGTKIGPSAPAPSHDPTLLPSMASQMRMPVSVHNQEQIARAERQLNSIADRLTAALAPLIDRGMISVRRTELWIEVEINSDILFPTGSAALDVHARQTLASLAEVLRDVPNSVRVEGHTDNVPIATATFPSNWELSAGRAASVVHLFADQGVQPSRLAMVGYGQFRPREENDSAQGRNRNRRVMVIILADTSHSVDPLGQRLNAATGAVDDNTTEQAAATPATAPTSPIAPVKLPPVPAGSRVGAAVPPAMKE